jgi:hypothetical protein
VLGALPELLAGCAPPGDEALEEDEPARALRADDDFEPVDAARAWPLPGAVCDPFRYGAGSRGWPLTRVSKCRCGPVEWPVVPT